MAAMPLGEALSITERIFGTEHAKPMGTLEQSIEPADRLHQPDAVGIPPPALVHLEERHYAALPQIGWNRAVLRLPSIVFFEQDGASTF